MPINISYDGSFDIAIGTNRLSRSWKNREWFWSEFLEKIKDTHRTAETMAEYAASLKSRQDEIKDIGGFVGGYITGGRRKKGSILHRQLITLDMDAGVQGIWDDFTLFNGCAAAIYSTHKHTPDRPRLRLLIPLDRPVEADEYQAISRMIAGDLNIEAFDPTTFEPERLMYWPSTSKDGVYQFDYQDGPWLSADAVLARYTDWRDSSAWPISEKINRILNREMKKAGDPLEKPGMVGTFCRRYGISEAIELFLGEVYEPCAGRDNADTRYTYLHGSTAAGLVVYEDRWAYSHHGTDPAGSKLCNAFDLVRLHLFGLKDEDAAEGTPFNRLPSYTAMVEWAAKDSGVLMQIGMDAQAQAEADFGAPMPSAPSVTMDGRLAGMVTDLSVVRDMDDDNQDHAAGTPDETAAPEKQDMSWLKKLEVDGKGRYLSTINNIMVILQNDPRLKNRLAFNDFEKRECCVADLPWRPLRSFNGEADYLTDTDDSGLRHYLETVYGITGERKVMDAMCLAIRKNAFHPVKEYLIKCEQAGWDGTPRIDTLLIDYLGAEDNPYTRAVTRKTLVAAVARIFRPGIKFDTVLTLLGPQGLGKSQLIKKLGGPWASDSFSGIGTNQAYEQIQGVWLVEIAELAALKRAEVDMIKHFITKTEDRFRVAYGRKPETFVRQCIFIATTNDTSGFLKDQTGNRRWWVVELMKDPGVAGKGAAGAKRKRKNIFTDLTESESMQIWAEAVQAYKAGEKLYLEGQVAKDAEKVQKDHTEIDDRTDLIMGYLTMPVPDGWDKMDIFERRAYIQEYKDNPGVMAGKNGGSSEGKRLGVSGRGGLFAGVVVPEGCYLRDKICAAEVWCEALGGTAKEMTSWNTKFIHTMLMNLEGVTRSKSTLRFSLYGHQRGYLLGVDFDDPEDV